MLSHCINQTGQNDYERYYKVRILNKWMGLLDIIKIAIGYEKKSHTFDSSKISEGDIKMISNDEMIKNEKGKIIVCKRGSNEKWKCNKPLPFKPRR